MFRFMLFTATVVLISVSAIHSQARFNQLKRIEAYEVRPGVLLMPKYTSTDQVCEIGIERLQFSSTQIRLSPELSNDELFQIIDEQVPVNERGQLAKNGGDELNVRGQNLSSTTKMEYENVVIRIYEIPIRSQNANGSSMTPLVATVRWKHRECRKE